MDIDTSSFSAIIDQVQRIRVLVGAKQREHPLKASVGEVVAVGDGKVFSASVGLARSHGCEVVLAQEAGNASRARPLLREFLGRFLAEDLDVGEHFICEGAHYTSEAMKVVGLGPGHSSLDAYLVAMESLTRVIEILPIEDAADQSHLQRSYVLKSVQASWLDGMTRGRLAREGAVWETTPAFAGTERRQTSVTPAWYATLPGYHALPVERPSDTPVGITLDLFGRDLLAACTPYADTLGAVSVYEELALIGTQPTGERVLTARAIHVCCLLNEDGLAGLEPHDHQWMSTFLSRNGRRLVPVESKATQALRPATAPSPSRPEHHLLRITSIEASGDDRTADTLRLAVRSLCRRVVQVSGAIPAITTCEARYLAGTELLGGRASGEDWDWVERALDEMGAVAARPADLGFPDGEGPVMPCRRHPTVYLVPPAG